MNKNSAGVEKYPVLILSGIEINHKYNSINSCVCVCVCVRMRVYDGGRR